MSAPPRPYPGPSGEPYTCPICHATSWHREPGTAPGYCPICRGSTDLTPGQLLALEVARAVDLELAGAHAVLGELAHRLAGLEGRLGRVETADQLIADHLGPGSDAEVWAGLEGL